ncbi:MAG: hypothetical protein DWQ18_07100 [Crenarchaeota archaeon]|nr:MAG: hypothetical protein DWQ17_02685 [Thermoproteota archaeon]RDJ32945.1 MAG: hypothetical protein DWQ18_07100 [Thermoproteota archaeon]RDJ35974.1 MAG: hypothetical protein DWQ13_08770 [Thermoproteota archaeon]RDJ38219.1 MAG: hypothetical protein DWQ19_00075 [Thermoproteota archaeon]
MKVNRHSIIVIIASIVIVGTLAYSFVNATSVENIEFRWNQNSSFDYIVMMHGGKIELCNASEFPVTVRAINMDLYFDNQKLGTFTVEPVTINSNSMIEATGISDMKENSSPIMLLFMNTEFAGTDIARIDSNKMFVQVNYNTSILGFIPLVVSEVYSGYEFYQIMNGEIDSFHCQ